MPIGKPGGTDLKILLVEDNRSQRLSNERALVAAGYEVICAENVESAVRRAKEHLPDLLLLDLVLSRVGALELLSRLKHGRRTAKIPVIILSGLSEQKRQKLIEAGAEDYLEKSAILGDDGVSLLPEALQQLMFRLNRKRGAPFARGLAAKSSG